LLAPSPILFDPVGVNGRIWRELPRNVSRRVQIEALPKNQVVFNLCRIHKTLHVTPAMEAGIANHVWSLEEPVGLLEA